ncbi:MAG: Omp28-related outer membrane protein [Paludibacteraceae bacterium]|nr:Omp28-related outer membrane protein [Paludibacteraceae bacterium]
MKTFRLFALLALSSLLLALSSCEPKPEPQPEPETPVIPESFPKKHLIEEFTGQGCGYCPYGMDCIHEFVANDTNYVLVLHHYGYAADHFTVNGSKTVTSALGVNGAPSMCINRAKIKSDAGTKIIFHPGYLPSVSKSQLEETTYASVTIRNTYDAASRELKVHVSGLLCRDDYPDLQLTVLIKESGMIDTQADYYNTFEGWQEFRHTNAVRAFLSAAKGDAVTVNANHQYEADYTLTLNQNWNADNCMVVAFLSEAFKPVVQAEQRPVVSGSKGGADLLHGGITPVPVPDYYPEPDAVSGPSDFSGNRSESIDQAQALYAQYQQYGITYWAIYLSSSSETVNVNNTTCVPYGVIYLLAPYNASAALPTGTFPVALSEEPGTIMAGYRNDETFEIGGSTFYFTSKSYYDQGYLVPACQWLIADGQMTITDEGWTLTGHARNGASINLTGTTPLQNKGKLSTPLRRIPGLIGM